MVPEKLIRTTLARIYNALNGCKQDAQDYGLLSGYSGMALFYGYYYRLTGKRAHLDRLNRTIEATLRTLAEKELTYSHCSGIAGMAWCIQHLINNELIEQGNLEDGFEEVDDMLFDIMKEELGACRYDFLHEGLGIMLYFLDKPADPKINTYLEAGVELLERSMVTNIYGNSWRDYSPKNMEDYKQAVVYNLGLSHGVPAILTILSMAHAKGIAKTRTHQLIEGGVKWLLNNRNEPADNCISLYPTIIAEDRNITLVKQSRLGWCYGDLSTAATLLNIGTRLKNEHFKNEAYTIYNYTLEHRNISNGSILDGSLCHGSMGVSHIYRRAFMQTGNTHFLKGANAWVEHTLQMATWRNGLAGFKYHTPKGYENNYNLLEGITGIGLGLIAAIDTGIVPAWDRCLLLS